MSVYNLTWTEAAALAKDGQRVRRWAWETWLEFRSGLWWIGPTQDEQTVVAAGDFGRLEFLVADWTTAEWGTATPCALPPEARHMPFVPPVFSLSYTRTGGALQDLNVTATLSDGIFPGYSIDVGFFGENLETRATLINSAWLALNPGSEFIISGAPPGAFTFTLQNTDWLSNAFFRVHSPLSGGPYHSLQTALISPIHALGAVWTHSFSILGVTYHLTGPLTDGDLTYLSLHRGWVGGSTFGYVRTAGAPITTVERGEFWNELMPPFAIAGTVTRTIPWLGWAGIYFSTPYIGRATVSSIPPLPGWSETREVIIT